jgi:hypothetical protein
MLWASESFSHRPVARLNYDQLLDKLDMVSRQLETEKLKVQLV